MLVGNLHLGKLVASKNKASLALIQSRKLIFWLILVNLESNCVISNIDLKIQNTKKRKRSPSRKCHSFPWIPRETKSVKATHQMLKTYNVLTQQNLCVWLSSSKLLYSNCHSYPWGKAKSNASFWGQSNKPKSPENCSKKFITFKFRASWLEKVSPLMWKPFFPHESAKAFYFPTKGKEKVSLRGW